MSHRRSQILWRVWLLPISPFLQPISLQSGLCSPCSPRSCPSCGHKELKPVFFSPDPGSSLPLQENSSQNQMTETRDGFSCGRAARCPRRFGRIPLRPWQDRSTKRGFRSRLGARGAANLPGKEQLPREGGSSCGNGISHSEKKWV